MFADGLHMHDDAYICSEKASNKNNKWRSSKDVEGMSSSEYFFIYESIIALDKLRLKQTMLRSLMC